MVINPLMGIFTWYPFSGCPWEGRPKTIYHVLTLANIEQDHLYFHGVFFFWDYPIIKPLNVESYPIWGTQTHLYAYCIYNRYQFVGLPKLSWVIHCTSFLVANGENGEYVTINHVSFLLQNVEPGTFRWWCTHCNLHNMLMYDAIENQWNLSLLLR